MTNTQRKRIEERLEKLQARQIPASDVPYETATALYQIALELNRFLGTQKD